MSEPESLWWQQQRWHGHHGKILNGNSGCYIKKRLERDKGRREKSNSEAVLIIHAREGGLAGEFGQLQVVKFWIYFEDGGNRIC